MPQSFHLVLYTSGLAVIQTSIYNVYLTHYSLWVSVFYCIGSFISNLTLLFFSAYLIKKSAPGHQCIYATYPKGIFSTTTDNSWNRPEVAAKKIKKKIQRLWTKIPNANRSYCLPCKPRTAATAIIHPCRKWLNEDTSKNAYHSHRISYRN